MKNIADQVEVWYLFHSGFALKYNNSVFIFDYYNNIPTNQIFDMAHGVINPEDIKDCSVYVFVSHSHYDHYNSIIFTWSKTIKDIHYIVSSDLKLNRSVNRVHVMKPHQTLSIETITVETLDSNDLGVAYIVEIDDLTIFHSGDLNWWHGNNPVVNEADERIFKTEYMKLANKAIDIAFIPVSPKLKQGYNKTLNFFLDNNAKDECYIFPMHFGLNISIFSWLKRDGLLDDHRIQEFIHRGKLQLQKL